MHFASTRHGRGQKEDQKYGSLSIQASAWGLPSRAGRYVSQGCAQFTTTHVTPPALKCTSRTRQERPESPPRFGRRTLLRWWATASLRSGRFEPFRSLPFEPPVRSLSAACELPGANYVPRGLQGCELLTLMYILG
jgi:hypothetical protein